MRLAPPLLLALCALLPAWAGAIDTEAAFDDPAMQARYERLTEELRCLVCQNQTIGDSDAPLASDLRRQVREMMVAGASDGEITDYMVERYGEFVLYRPRWTPRTVLLWTAPVLFLAGGVLVLARVLRRRAELYAKEQESTAA